MNLPNKITLMRICLVPPFIWFMFLDNLWTRIFALIIVIIAGISDTIDGIIARKYNMVSKFGIFLDPLADKLIVTSALISFVGLKELHIPAWMVVFITSREFIITGLRLLALSRGKIIAADKTGKFKTTSQTVSIIIILVILIINSALKKFYNINSGDITFLKHAPFWIMFYVTLITVYSGVRYILKHKEVLINEPPE